MGGYVGGLLDQLGKRDERLRDIVIMRYFEGKTQEEIGKILEVSGVRIGQLEQNALDKLRLMIAANEHSRYNV